MNTLLYWVAIPMLANILLILFVVVSLRRLARRLEEDAVAGAVERVLATLTPLVAQARELSQTFDAQLREKQSLIQTLNESMDRRATALTLLVNRTEATLKSGENQRLTPESLDLQEAVLDLAAQGKIGRASCRERV